MTPQLYMHKPFNVPGYLLYRQVSAGKAGEESPFFYTYFLMNDWNTLPGGATGFLGLGAREATTFSRIRDEQMGVTQH